MKARRKVPARYGLYAFALLWMIVILPLSALAAPYAAMVMDARTGEVLHARNADTRLHPASLTKMMTLYIAFQAVERGEISLDTKVRISRNAAAEPPSKLGLKAGQTIALRYLIRAAAIKSANDAATAIGEALEGSEAAFARRMNRTAKALGMSNTTFKNANGLTETGHLSTARDMTVLGRHLIYDFPQYYNLFSRRTADAGGRAVANTNRRLLAAYKGADGIKTGYTRAAGFNLVASAERGQERVIATVFGGTSTSARNARVAELLDLGFKHAPSTAPVRMPEKAPAIASAAAPERGPVLLAASLRPQLRPGPVATASAATPEDASSPRPDDVLAAVESAQASTASEAGTPPELAEDIAAAVSAARTASPAALASTSGVLSSDIASALVEAREAPAEPEAAPAKGGLAPASLRPALRPKDLVESLAEATEQAEVVTRMSTSGGRQWGVNVGRYPSQHLAERALVTTALTEMDTLDGTLRKVVKRTTGFDANFLGMSRDSADLACRRLAARQIECTTVGPS